MMKLAGRWLLLGLAATPVGAGPPFVLEWDGSPSTTLAIPRWVAADGAGRIVLSDNTRILEFDETGVFIGRVGEGGTGPGQYQNPNGVAFRAGELFFAEHAWNHRVQRFDAGGSYVLHWGGAAGSEDGQFQSPQGVAAGTVVYVADRANDRVQKFDDVGTFLGKWGGPGAAAGDFDRPTGIAVDSQGDVYVSDSDNHRIQKFAADGTFVREWGGFGVGDGQFDSPRGVAIAPGDVIFVVDEGNHRVQEFDRDGTFLRRWGTNGSGPGEFSNPHGIAIDAGRGSLYVVDTGNARVQKFAWVASVEPSSFGAVKARYRTPPRRSPPDRPRRD